MWEVMRAAMARVAARREGRRHAVQPPDIVMMATRQLIERESPVVDFVKKRMKQGDEGAKGGYLTLKEAYNASAWRTQCARGEHNAR
jgi:hypothetical protein